MSKVIKEENRPVEKKSETEKAKVWRYDFYFPFALLSILAGIYYFLYENYIFYYQENLSLFIYSIDYLNQFSSKPGGLLEYTGNFLSQFYFSNLYGTLILTSVITCVGIVIYKINNRLSAIRPVSLLFTTLATCFIILIQTNINYQIHNNLGFLFSLLYFLFSVSSEKKSIRILVLALFPLFYYLAGAYSWIFLGMYVVYNLYRKRVLYPLTIIIIAGITILLFKGVIFLQSWHDLLNYPMPLKGIFDAPLAFWLLSLFFIFYPVLLILSGWLKTKYDDLKAFSFSLVLIPVLLTIFLLSEKFNKDVEDLFKLEKMFIARDWKGVIKCQETLQSENPMAQYYYNIALSESRLLCDRLFYSPQNYGSRAMSIAWNDQVPINKLFRGVYFYYSIGLINEAHRWAFESMVIQGYRPENIKLLIKTNLINGHYKVAGKYIALLKKTLHYHKLALKYEAMTLNPDIIKSDPELGEKMQLKPKDDFIVRIRNPLMNISYLIQSNPLNRKAFEYEMACLMLDKNLKGMINILERVKDMNYQQIPRYMEEAILFIEGNIGPLPLLTGYKISEETRSRFSAYMASLRNIDRTKPVSGSVIPKELRNTFWYYIEFVKSQ
jgi:hypothetical protein